MKAKPEFYLHEGRRFTLSKKSVLMKFLKDRNLFLAAGVTWSQAHRVFLEAGANLKPHIAVVRLLETKMVVPMAPDEKPCP